MFHSIPADKAIRDKDVGALRDLLGERRVTCDDPFLAPAIVRWGDPVAVTLAGQYFEGRGLARALNEALEMKREDLTHLLITEADRRLRRHGQPPLNLHQALYEAATSGRLVAMDALFDMGATVKWEAKQTNASWTEPPQATRWKSSNDCCL